MTLPPGTQCSDTHVEDDRYNRQNGGEPEGREEFERNAQ